MSLPLWSILLASGELQNPAHVFWAITNASSKTASHHQHLRLVNWDGEWLIEKICVKNMKMPTFGQRFQSDASDARVQSAYQLHWFGRFQQPSWVGSSLWHPRCWREHCGSTTAADTRHGQWRLRHAEESWTQNKRHKSGFQKTDQLGRFSLHLLSHDRFHLFLLSLALTMAGPMVSISISAAPSLSRILRREIFYF